MELMIDLNEPCMVEKELSQTPEEKASGKPPRKELVEAFTIVKAEVVPLYQKLRSSGTIEPAPGILFGVTKDGKPKLPIQVSMYAGGMNIDVVGQDGGLNRILSYGFDRRQQRNLVRGRTGMRPTQHESDIADFVLGIAATILDSDEGRAFRSWLHTDEAREEAAAKRTTRQGFSKALAVSSDHYYCVRNSSSGEEYAQLAEDRRTLRESGVSPRGAAVSGSLPF